MTTNLTLTHILKRTAVILLICTLVHRGMTALGLVGVGLDLRFFAIILLYTLPVVLHLKHLGVFRQVKQDTIDLPEMIAELKSGKPVTAISPNQMFLNDNATNPPHPIQFKNKSGTANIYVTLVPFAIGLILGFHCLIGWLMPLTAETFYNPFANLGLLIVSLMAFGFAGLAYSAGRHTDGERPTLITVERLLISPQGVQIVEDEVNQQFAWSQVRDVYEYRNRGNAPQSYLKFVIDDKLNADKLKSIEFTEYSFNITHLPYDDDELVAFMRLYWRKTTGYYSGLNSK